MNVLLTDACNVLMLAAGIINACHTSDLCNMTLEEFGRARPSRARPADHIVHEFHHKTAASKPCKVNFYNRMSEQCRLPHQMAVCSRLWVQETYYSRRHIITASVFYRRGNGNCICITCHNVYIKHITGEVYEAATKDKTTKTMFVQHAIMYTFIAFVF